MMAIGTLKRVAGNIICIYAVYAQVVGFFNKKCNMLHGLNNIKMSYRYRHILFRTVAYNMESRIK
jgi:hypothetical protein